MEREPILVIVRDGNTKIFSLDTTQEVYIIDQRGCNKQNPPTLYQASIINEDVKPFRHTISEIEYALDQIKDIMKD